VVSLRQVPGSNSKTSQSEFHTVFPQSPWRFPSSYFPVHYSPVVVNFNTNNQKFGQRCEEFMNNHISCWSLLSLMLCAQTPLEVSSFNLQSVTADPLQPCGVWSRCNLLCSTDSLFDVWIVSNAVYCLLYRI
jgi:hypothetical protein